MRLLFSCEELATRRNHLVSIETMEPLPELSGQALLYL
jgi:hypothetical protein